MSGRSLVSKRCVTVQLVDPCRLCHQRVPNKHTNSSKQSHRQPTVTFSFRGEDLAKRDAAEELQ